MLQCLQYLVMNTPETAVAHDQDMISGFYRPHNALHQLIEILVALNFIPEWS